MLGVSDLPKDWDMGGVVLSAAEWRARLGNAVVEANIKSAEQRAKMEAELARCMRCKARRREAQEGGAKGYWSTVKREGAGEGEGEGGSRKGLQGHGREALSDTAFVHDVHMDDVDECLVDGVPGDCDYDDTAV